MYGRSRNSETLPTTGSITSTLTLITSHYIFMDYFGQKNRGPSQIVVLTSYIGESYARVASLFIAPYSPNETSS